MADQRFRGFETVPTHKVRGIDLSIGTWRGLALPKATSANVVGVLTTATRAAAADPQFAETLGRRNLGFSFADADTFRTAIQKDNAFFKQLIAKLDLKT